MKFRIGLVCGVALLVLLGVTLFASRIYMSEGLVGRVVDSESKEPIAGVIVVANWELKGLEGFVTEQLQIAEVITDKTGQFIIPSWGPVKAKSAGELRPSEPTVRIFKPGYEPLVLFNAATSQTWTVPHVLRLTLTSGTLELRRYKGDADGYAEILDPLVRSMSFVYSGGDCAWTKSVRLLGAVEESRSRVVDPLAKIRIPSAAGIRSSVECQRNAKE
jgi:hypothetical protein